MSQTSTIELEATQQAPVSKVDLSSRPDVQNPSAAGRVLDVADPSRAEFLLPPVDGGKDAWLFIAAAFTSEALIWGFPTAFGVFQDYYSTHAPFAGEPNVAVVGTCAMGLMYLIAPLAIGACRLFSRWPRWVPVVGQLIMSASLAAASFGTTVPQLVATQGLLYAIGGGLAYAPCVLYLEEWFVKRKGLAYGIMMSATGLAGCVLPLLLESLLHRFGHRTTLRVWSGLLFLVTGPLALCLKPRLPPSATATARPFDLRFLTMPTFWLYQGPNIIQSMGYFLPTIYLPVYARSVYGVPTFTSATTVLAVNVTNFLGCVGMGWLVDRFHVTTCLLLSSLGSAAGVLAVWGLAPTLPALYVFCLLYGLFAGSFSSCWPGIMKEVALKAGGGGATSYGYIEPCMVFGFLCAGRGVGNLVSGPLSDSLIGRVPGGFGFGYASAYACLIVFTGLTALLGGASFVWRRIGLL